MKYKQNWMLFCAMLSSGCAIADSERPDNEKQNAPEGIYVIRSALDPNSRIFQELRTSDGTVRWLGTYFNEGEQEPVAVSFCDRSTSYFCGNILGSKDRFAIPKKFGAAEWEFEGLSYKIWGNEKNPKCHDDILIKTFKNKEYYAFLRYNRSYGIKEIFTISQIKLDPLGSDYPAFLNTYIIQNQGLWSDPNCKY